MSCQYSLFAQSISNTAPVNWANRPENSRKVSWSVEKDVVHLVANGVRFRWGEIQLKVDQVKVRVEFASSNFAATFQPNPTAGRCRGHRLSARPLVRVKRHHVQIGEYGRVKRVQGRLVEVEVVKLGLQLVVVHAGASTVLRATALDQAGEKWIDKVAGWDENLPRSFPGQFLPVELIDGSSQPAKKVVEDGATRVGSAEVALKVSRGEVGEVEPVYVAKPVDGDFEQFSTYRLMGEVKA